VIPILRALLATCILAVSARADVPVIENPREAPARRTVAYEEVWRAGADDAADFIFGVIGDAETDAAGNVYLLDTQQYTVFKFGPDGEYLGTVSRRGEGPGEINMCFSMERWDADRLALDKTMPSSLVLVANDGTPDRNLRFQFEPRSENQRFAFAHGLQIRDDHLVTSGQAMRLEHGLRITTHFTVTLDRELREIHNFGDHESGVVFADEVTVDEAREFSPVATWALGRGGEVYFAPRRDDWLIEVRRSTGELARVIRRDFEPHRRTKEEKEAAKSRWTFSSDGSLPPIHYRMCDTDPAIARLDFLGDELRVWGPRSNEELPEGIATRFDVLDRAGRLVEERSLAFPYDPDQDGLHHLADGRLVRVKAFRSSQEASMAGFEVQKGEEKVDGSDSGDVVLEVIVYRPLDD
jgi:hypothetical protein